ncbi:hypothetical protein NFIA_013090 [Paecilomyces variotii No. 5]|uniref:CRAL-TRIO domain-containing protein n=1 Tax=Byssochlamys spectabilis (strain No. 5 / NBRC 109023) TaxID=1356009 RepID=V5FP25_BYSSN|nr:hypothetical protein NFIA_013090 [Paecilomyces variotii No. 5]
MGSISPPSGYVGNLTEWQEAKLVEVWRLALQAFGMYRDICDIPKTEVARVRKFWMLGMRKINIKIEDATSQDKAMVRKFVSEGLKSIKVPPDESEIIMNRVELLLFGEKEPIVTKNGVPIERDQSALPPAVRKIIDEYKPADLMELFWSTLRKDSPDALVLRFLRARKWDVDKAIEMMINVGWWRVGEMRVDDITRAGEAGALADLSSQDEKVRKEASDFIDQLRVGKAYLHGIDKQGRPVCYIRVRLHKIGEHTKSSLEKFTVHLIETVRLTMAQSVETAVIVFDMTGFGLTNMDYLHVKFVIQCFEVNYPESLGAILVHKAPWVFSSIWPMIRGWLDPTVAKKVHFTKNVQDLEAFIRRDRIPKELCGDDDWEYLYIEPRPGENDLMKDTAKRDLLMERRTGLFHEFRENVSQWVIAAENGDDTTDIKNKREEIINKVESSYWELDPYIRAKIRRVKCGEEKPDCIRCTSTGRKCEYESTISRTYSSSDCSASIFDCPFPLFSNSVWRERRAFAYYFQSAAISIGGGLDAEFWLTVVPQVCRSEPAVWDALISISSLFENPERCHDLSSSHLEHTRTVNRNQQDALAWYSRSVSAIRKGLERGNVDTFVGLITCVLFICMEALFGGMSAALQLYRQGVRLIHVLQAQDACKAMTRTEASLLKDTIIPIFIRIGAVTLSSQESINSLLGKTEREFGERFTSLKSAREAIVILAIEIPLFELDCEEYLLQSHASQISEEMLTRRESLSKKLQNWYTTFTGLIDSLQTRHELLALRLNTASVLFSYYEMLSVILGVCTSPLRMTTDAYTSNFQNIVQHSHMSLTASARCDGTQPPFTFELSVGLPLWFTCVRCRHRTIRRRALSLLSRAHQIEGLYQRDYGTTMCERIMMLEEMSARPSSAAQSIADSMSRRAEYAYIHQYRHGDICAPSSPFSVDSALSASPSLAFAEKQFSTLEAEFIPAEARIKPLGIFRPRDGYPPEMTIDDITKLSRSPDQTFLYYSRNAYVQDHNTWQTIYAYVSIEL